MVTNYGRGANFEREVRKHLQERGYPCWRVAGSKGEGSVDLVAYDTIEKRLLLIQAKVDGHASNTEMDALLSIAARTGAHPLIAYRDRGVKFVRVGPDHQKYGWEAEKGGNNVR
jgi:Holliday junction resolvase